MASNIIDNNKDVIERQLLYNVKKALDGSVEAKFAIGYFFLSGFSGIQRELNREGFKKLRLLIGNTSDRETIEQLAEGYNHLERVKSANKKIEFGKKKQKLDDTKQRVKSTLEGMDQTDENEGWMYNLAELISKEKIRVRVYTRGRLHSKAYIFDYPPDLRAQYGPGMAIIGSSNLSMAGMYHNTELNIKTRDERDHEDLTKWFMDLWKNSENFDESLMELLKVSWPIAEVTPYELYLKTLYHLVEDRLEEEKDIKLFWKDTLPTLTNFQEVAVKTAISIIKQYNGAFISDVVGLGKTYIGSGVLKYFADVYGYKPLIICPKSLVDMWEESNEKYELGAKVLSMSMLSDRNKNLLKRYENCDIVLIDESHNFRYPNTKRYELLQPFTSRRKTVLLTATPLNNTPLDIYYQIKLFHAKDRTKIPVAPANLKEFFKTVENGEAALSSILSHLLVRRTRKQIIKYYGKKDNNGKYYVRIGKKRNYFPERDLKTLSYSIDEVYEGIYDRVYESLSRLTLARYGLYDYVLPAKQNKHPYLELKSAGQNLKGLVRSGLFKRFESSSFAFKRSIENFIKINTIFLEALKKGYVPAGEEVQKVIYDSQIEEDEDLAEILQNIEGLSEKYDIKDFDVPALEADISSDLRILEEIFGLVKDIPGLWTDTKLRELMTKLKSPELKGKKVLVFTEFVDTANYIYEELKGHFKRNMEVITGNTKDRHKVVGRFAPRSNQYTFENGEEEIDILISTDVLSEGLNLQDCSDVINYDLHWNPVRLIQRIGRVDRIGTEAEVIRVYNFLPEKKLEKNLKLKEKLDIRIKEIHTAIGEDTYILHTREMLNTEAMYAIYDENPEELDRFEEEDEKVKVSEAEDIIRKLQKEEPELLERIKNISMGVRSARQSPDGNKYRFVFLKKGNYKRLYLLDPKGNIVFEDEAKILKIIKCNKDEPVLKIPPGYNKTVSDMKKKFSQMVKEAEDAGEKVKLTTGQRYIKKALNEFRKEVEVSEFEDAKEKEDLISKIVEFERVFTTEIPSKPLNKQLTLIKNNEIKGEELMKKLEILYYDHNLARMVEEIEEKEDPLTYIVCSEALE
jgi:superfamily II DNA or RNA helicase